ncbi:MAG: UDP-N-acetylmuramoyl-L-alanyl-D-glutamate--2,6-diaminopimelate ligase [Oscillospiraceae bacterium]|jgi:UDP-N-acetylmuramoyl-L-alanyl-D-glutamate--2,6-diaminopimelate ligase|nr:UDP-N-acetylmuramoyl-L-alanyl-D-glutamate--2,6-diaminopimelate ligase [Oscillospiraceae bacterium]MCI1990394.1 UDP-N-acetylmuramoyl-L-alanyl-D-glutamate--2,6-diaminopimelate ligase [Oscillospiraceae bacterium]MCI2036069.1 UDP-N-acetylmuramoyl-L-alanyl-D-glutamate--2,6-diaminopimelate ligase [Oscillospiraceae bacterium]
MLLKNLLEGLPCTCTGPTDVEIEDVVYDSRKVKKGSLFICLRGSSVDSHQYAGRAASAGAAAVVAQRPVEHGGSTLVLVRDTRTAMAAISAAWFGHPAERMTVVGITGTKGKTTVSYMIRSILEAGGIKTGIIGTIGAVVGGKVIQTDNTTPESYDVQKYLRMMADAGCKAAVLEASSIGIRDHRVDGIVFDYGLFTNFSPDHIGGNEHKSIKEYMQCKSLLFRRCKTGIFNIDDPNWQGVAAGHTCAVETYGFSRKARLRASGEKLISRPGYLGVHFEMDGRAKYGVDVCIPGRFSIYNALAAAAVCLHFPVGEDAVRTGLNTVRVKGRVEPVSVPGNYTLLIDYAHNALSMENILETLREYQPHRLICLFGAGGNRDRSRRFEMGEVSGRLADLSVITADNSRFEDVMDIIADIKVGIAKTTGKYVVIPDRKQAIKYCMENAQDGDIIVLAGKGHEDYQEIKGVKYHLDEREVVADVLAGRL